MKKIMLACGILLLSLGLVACKTADNSTVLNNSDKKISKASAKEKESKEKSDDDNNYDDVLQDEDDSNTSSNERDLEAIDKESNLGLIEEMYDRIDQGENSISAKVNNLIQNVDVDKIDKEITVLENVIRECEENSDMLSTEVKSSDATDSAIDFWDNTVSVLEDQKSLLRSISSGDGNGPDSDSYTKKVDEWKNSYNKVKRLLN